MNKNTKKILWLVAIAAVIIIFLALVKKQREEQEDSEAGESVVDGLSEVIRPATNFNKIPSGQSGSKPYTYTLRDGYTAEKTSLKVPSQSLSTNRSQLYRPVTSLQPAASKGINYFDANCR